MGSEQRGRVIGFWIRIRLKKKKEYKYKMYSSIVWSLSPPLPHVLHAPCRPQPRRPCHSFRGRLSPPLFTLSLLTGLEPNPYAYDSTVTDPSQPPSPFVQAMREQEEMFFAAFPEARKAAEYRERRKEHLLALLASRNANFFPSTRPYCRQGPLHSQPSLQPQPTVPVAAFTAPVSVV